MVHCSFMKTIALVSEFLYYGRISTSKIENADCRYAATTAKISPQVGRAVVYPAISSKTSGLLCKQEVKAIMRHGCNSITVGDILEKSHR